MVELEDRIRISNDMYGTVKFIGELTGKDGTWIGCELDEPVGKNNGTFNGKRYFVCKEKHGIFIRKERIKHNYQIKLSEIEENEKNIDLKSKNIENLVLDKDTENYLVNKIDEYAFYGDDIKENDDVRRILQENLDASKISALNEKIKELKSASRHKIEIFRMDLEKEKERNIILQEENKKLIEENKRVSSETNYHKRYVFDKIRSFQEEILEIVNVIKTNVDEIETYGTKFVYNSDEYKVTCNSLINLIRACLDNNLENMDLYSRKFKEIMKRKKIFLDFK